MKERRPNSFAARSVNLIFEDTRGEDARGDPRAGPSEKCVSGSRTTRTSERADKSVYMLYISACFTPTRCRAIGRRSFPPREFRLPDTHALIKSRNDGVELFEKKKKINEKKEITVEQPRTKEEISQFYLPARCADSISVLMAFVMNSVCSARG